MKKIITFLLLVSIVLGSVIVLTGCGDETKNETTTTSAVATTITTTKKQTSTKAGWED